MISFAAVYRYLTQVDYVSCLPSDLSTLSQMSASLKPTHRVVVDLEE